MKFLYNIYILVYSQNKTTKNIKRKLAKTKDIYTNYNLIFLYLIETDFPHYAHPDGVPRENTNLDP